MNDAGTACRAHILHPEPVEHGTIVAPRPALYGLPALAPYVLPLMPKEYTILWTICMVLLVLWLLGMVTSYTAGGLIHILLVVGIVILIIRLLQGRRLSG